MDAASSSAHADLPFQRRQVPARNRRVTGGGLNSEVDLTIQEALKYKETQHTLLSSSTCFHLTTDSSYAESSGDAGRIVNNVVEEQFYNRPDVIRSFREQQIIQTPDVVPIEGDVHSRFRPREGDMGLVHDSDDDFLKRHKRYENSEKRTRLRELESLRNEHHRLKIRMEQYKTMDSLLFLTLPPDVFPPPPAQEDGGDVPSTYSVALLDSAAAYDEGERRRREMLKTAHAIDERYRTLLPDENKGGKKAAKLAAASAQLAAASAIPIPPPTVKMQTVVTDIGERGNLKDFERPKLKLPIRSKASTPSIVSAPSPASSKLSTTPSVPPRRGRPSKSALTALKEKNPAPAQFELATPPPPPSSSRSSPVSAMQQDLNLNGANMEISPLPSYSSFTLPPPPTSVPTASAPLPFLPSLPPSASELAPLATSVPLPIARIIKPAEPRGEALPISPSPEARFPDGEGKKEPDEEGEEALISRPRKRVKQSSEDEPVRRTPPIPPRRAPSLPAIESISTTTHFSPAPSPQITVSNTTVSTTSSSRRGPKAGGKAKPRCIVAWAASRPGGRGRTPRQIAFGAKLPVILTNQDVYEYEIPPGLLSSPVVEVPTSAAFPMIGREPDGSDGEDDDRYEAHDIPDLEPQAQWSDHEVMRYRSSSRERSSTREWSRIPSVPPPPVALPPPILRPIMPKPSSSPGPRCG